MRKHLHNQAEHSLPAQQQPLDPTGRSQQSHGPDQGHTPPPAKYELGANGAPDQHRHTACTSQRQTVTDRLPAPAQFCRGLLWLVVRVCTSATGRLTVLVVVIVGRVPLLPSVAV